MKKAKTRLQRGIYARTPRGFAANVRHMEQEGYGKKRAMGTAYGEADLDMKYQRMKRSGRKSHSDLYDLITKTC